jgi:hypothetical protein
MCGIMSPKGARPYAYVNFDDREASNVKIFAALALHRI